MKFDQLLYFVETARRQHIGQASRFLNISASAISHSISALEDELGKKLFEKKGRQIKLTQAGKQLFERAEGLLSDVQSLKDEISSDQKEFRGHYRIAATHLLSSKYLTSAWMSIQANNHSLTGTLQSLRSGEILTKVNSGELDLGFCFSPHTGPNHEQELIHTGELLICCGKKHPFLKEKNAANLSKYPAIAALSTQGIENCENHPSLQKLNIQQKVINLFDSYEVAIEALKTNTVWTLLPDFIANKYEQEIVTYIPKGWSADYTISAVWPRYRFRTPVLDLLVHKMRHNIASS